MGGKFGILEKLGADAQAVAKKIFGASVDGELKKLSQLTNPPLSEDLLNKTLENISKAFKKQGVDNEAIVGKLKDIEPYELTKLAKENLINPQILVSLTENAKGRRLTQNEFDSFVSEMKRFYDTPEGSKHSKYALNDLIENRKKSAQNAPNNKAEESTPANKDEGVESSNKSKETEKKSEEQPSNNKDRGAESNNKPKEAGDSGANKSRATAKQQEADDMGKAKGGAAGKGLLGSAATVAKFGGLAYIINELAEKIGAWLESFGGLEGLMGKISKLFSDEYTFGNTSFDYLRRHAEKNPGKWLAPEEITGMVETLGSVGGKDEFGREITKEQRVFTVNGDLKGQIFYYDEHNQIVHKNQWTTADLENSLADGQGGRIKRGVFGSPDTPPEAQDAFTKYIKTRAVEERNASRTEYLANTEMAKAMGNVPSFSKNAESFIERVDKGEYVLDGTGIVNSKTGEVYSVAMLSGVAVDKGYASPDASLNALLGQKVFGNATQADIKVTSNDYPQYKDPNRRLDAKDMNVLDELATKEGVKRIEGVMENNKKLMILGFHINDTYRDPKSERSEVLREVAKTEYASFVAAHTKSVHNRYDELKNKDPQTLTEKERDELKKLESVKTNVGNNGWKNIGEYLLGAAPLAKFDITREHNGINYVRGLNFIEKPVGPMDKDEAKKILEMSAEDYARHLAKKDPVKFKEATGFDNAKDFLEANKENLRNIRGNTNLTADIINQMNHDDFKKNGMIYLDKHYGNAIMDGTAARLIEALGAIAGDSKFTDAKTLETIKASSTLNRENGNVFAISFDPNSSDVIGIKTADIPEERLLSVKTFSTDEELRMQEKIDSLSWEGFINAVTRREIFVPGVTDNPYRSYELENNKQSGKNSNEMSI